MERNAAAIGMYGALVVMAAALGVGLATGHGFIESMSVGMLIGCVLAFFVLIASLLTKSRGGGPTP